MSRSATAFLTLLAFAASGCGPTSDAPNGAGGGGPTISIDGAGGEDKRADRPPIFVDATEKLGLDFIHEAGPGDKYFFPAIMGGGGALLDFDNDGDLDIYLVNGNRAQGGETNDAANVNRLYQQKADGRFEDVTERSGLGDAGYGMGVAVADVNNDGFVDVYVTNYGADQLYVNRGDGTFKNVTEIAGVDNLRWGASATFVDLDRDGWLDLYVTNYVDYFPSRLCKSRGGTLDFCSPSAFPGLIDKVYRNLGEARGEDAEVRFKDITVSTGAARKRGPGLGVAAGDFNGDNWPDVYVANDGAANFLWTNQKDETLVDEAVARGAALDRQGQAQAGMGVAVADVNRDGRFDLFITHLGGESNALYVATDSNDFDEDSVRYGLGVSSYRATGFGTAFVDLENDGDEDAIVVNGRVTRPPGTKEDAEGFWNAYGEQNHYLIRNDEGRFELVRSTQDSFLQPTEVSRALCVGDIDNDGDFDLLVVNLAGKARLYLNEAEKKGHWLIVSARESQQRGGRDAYGAVVRLGLKTDGADASTTKPAMRMINPGTSYLSSNDPRVHFGLGDTTEVAGVDVTWVDGKREWFEVTGVDQQITVTRGEGSSRE